MNKNEIKEKLQIEKNANLIDILEIGNKKYAKALLSLKNNKFNIIYRYYEIEENSIKELNEEEREKIKMFFEKKYGNVVY